MASGKKKQDDKNFKILRELAALPNNKQCFECHQRGPTYVDMTVGSFVCTSCSGLLRGLNPPHRVKSISMATFTVDEVGFIKSKGNEYCNKIWMGRCESGRSFDEASYKDETQMKDFLISKYEKKRWYVSPSEVISKQSQAAAELKSFNPVVSKSTSVPSAIGHGSASQNASLRPVLQNKLQTSNVSPQYSLNSCAPKLPSNAASPEPEKIANGGSSGDGDDFANFANFEAFQDSSSQNASGLLPASLVSALTPLSKFIPQPCSDSREPDIPKSATVPFGLSKPATEETMDKYSALAELDELFRNDSSANTANAATSNVGGAFSDLSFTSTAGSFGAASPTGFFNNPFTGFSTSSVASTPATNSMQFNTSSGDFFAPPASFAANPFRSAAPQYTNPFMQPSVSGQSKLYASPPTAITPTAAQSWMRPQSQFQDKLSTQSSQQVKWNPFL